MTLPGNSSTISYEDLWDGTQLSPCPLPCSTTHTDTRLLAEYPGTKNSSRINLTFSTKVEVTTTDFLKFYLSTVLSDLGGSMGLWLGLGMVQAVEVVCTCMLPRLTSEGWSYQGEAPRHR